MFWILPAAAATATSLVAADHATVQLIAPANVTAGAPFDMVVRLTPEKGWHTYWKNPGDSGIPTKIRWSLPTGVEAGDTEWSAPERIDEPGAITVYGFHGAADLLASMTVAAESKPALAAHVSWLVCRDECVAENADLSVTIEAGAASARRFGAPKLIARARELLPRPAPFAVHVEQTAESLLLSCDRGAGEAEFFPSEPGFVDPAGTRSFTHDAAHSHLTLSRPARARAASPRLSGVLVLDGNPYAIDLELPQEKTK